MKILKVGDKLYRYTGVKILAYEVYGVVTRDVGTMYEVRCLDCNDHAGCELLIADGGKNGYKFIDMISEENQSYWHNTDNGKERYMLTKDEAVKNRLESAIDYYKEQKQKSEKNIKHCEDKISEHESLIEALGVKNDN